MDKYSVYDKKLIFELCDYADIPINTPIVNTHTIPYKVHIHMPEVVSVNYTLFQIDHILPDTGEVNFAYCIDKKHNHPWIDILSELLDWSPGQHIYKFSFIQQHTNDICELYISYRSQDDDPEKPYIYMDKYRNCEGK